MEDFNKEMLDFNIEIETLQSLFGFFALSLSVS